MGVGVGLGATGGSPGLGEIEEAGAVVAAPQLTLPQQAPFPQTTPQHPSSPMAAPTTATSAAIAVAAAATAAWAGVGRTVAAAAAVAAATARVAVAAAVEVVGGRARRGRPLCGFVSPNFVSPFHFGAVPPPQQVVSGRRSFPSTPRMTAEEGGGLPALRHPAVAAARAHWLAQLAVLRGLPGADQTLLEEVRGWVEHGVKSVFPRGPPPLQKLRNTATFKKHEGVCLERMQVYMEMGALRAMSAPPPPGGHIQPLHAVVKEGKKARVCVDLSQNFNDFIPDAPFRMASVQDGVDMGVRARGQSGRPAWFVKLDISACFLSFPIHHDDLRYFYCEAGGDFYQFLALVFGRKDAPRVVSILLDVVSTALWGAGVSHVRYLDDFLLVATTSHRAWACAHAAANLFVLFGLALSLEKVEGPAQVIEFLGIVLDSVGEVLAISEGRRRELVGLLEAFSRRQSSSVRRLQSLQGKLAFAATVLPGARPFLRRIIDMSSGHGGNRKLSAEFRMEVRYWLGHVLSWNGRARWRAPTAEPWVFASDASTSGFAYTLERCPPAALQGLEQGFGPGTVRAGVWSAANGDAVRQSTSAEIQWGEFFSPLAAVLEYGVRLENQHLLFVIDNNSDVAVINRMRSREPRVAALLRAMVDASVKYNFTFAALHRPGEANVLMDWASRPDLHRFATVAPAWGVVGGLDGGCGVGLWAAGAGQSRPYPPLLKPTSITYTNSRCLSFGSEGNSASWERSCAGWSSCAAASAWRTGPTAHTGGTRTSSCAFVKRSNWTRCR